MLDLLLSALTDSNVVYWFSSMHNFTTPLFNHTYLLYYDHYMMTLNALISHNFLDDKNRKSHTINEEAVKRCHCCYIFLSVEIASIGLSEVINLLHIGHLPRYHLLRDCGLLVVEFVLRM